MLFSCEDINIKLLMNYGRNLEIQYKINNLKLSDTQKAPGKTKRLQLCSKMCSLRTFFDDMLLLANLLNDFDEPEWAIFAPKLFLHIVVTFERSAPIPLSAA